MTATGPVHRPGKELDNGPASDDRLSSLSEAILHIYEVLDPDVVLQRVLKWACLLTGARHGAIGVFDASGHLLDLVTDGISAEDLNLTSDSPPRLAAPGHFNEGQEFVGSGGGRSFSGATVLESPISRQGETLGSIYLGDKEGDQEFARKDEEILLLLASQAAMAITNARRLREEQSVRADLETVLNLSPTAVLVFDAKTRDLISLNHECRRILRGYHSPGHSLTDLLGFLTFRRPDGREVTLQELPLERVISSGEILRAEEIVIHLPDGQQVPTVFNAAPVFSDEGELVTVVVTIQDMTPVEEVERLRAGFLGLVSRELRGPLTAIKGSAATVLGASSAPDPSEMRQFFQLVNDQADRMRILINNLLDVTQIEAGTLSVSPEPCDVAELINEAIGTPSLGGIRNRIQVGLPEVRPRIAADRQRIVQLLRTLFSNASIHSPDSSPIFVNVAQEDFHFIIEVADTGVGISPERLPHLFKKFSRATGADEVRDIGETGLGLAICKGIVEAHGGRLWAESDGPGLGARFTFTIPAVEQPPRLPPKPEKSFTTASELAVPMRARILVVDDEPEILRHVKRTLSRAGHEPAVATDPREVERLISVVDPHLILLDLTLPGTDGFELMDRISSITDAPVIFLLDQFDDDVVSAAFQAGAADCVVKPLTPGELVSRTRAALQRGVASAQTRLPQPFELKGLRIDYGQRLVTVWGRTVQLTATEYRLLAVLSANAGRVLTHDQLLRRVWGADYTGNPRLLHAFITSLRRKLDDNARNPSFIFTEHGVGYRISRG